MQVILFDTAVRYNLLPFTHTRPIADIRCGILTLRERWAQLLELPAAATLTEDYLQEVYPLTIADNNLLINGALLATPTLAQAIRNLPCNSRLMQQDVLLAICTDQQSFSFQHLAAQTAHLTTFYYEEPVTMLRQVWDIFSRNGHMIRQDFWGLTQGRSSAPIPDYVTAIAPENIFIEAGAILAPCIINAADGPVYIGPEAEIMDGCMLRAPLALGAHATLKMGAKIYGDTTIGPGCKVGGEVSNTVFLANSNKGHDGFIGNAVIGEWCNLGADTNCSNLKNNYDEVKIWHEHSRKSITTGLQFCGLLMGDHSKCGINTMFNTGTVVGVSANIFGAGFPEKFIPSFCWGGSEGMRTYHFERAMDTANRMLARRQKNLSEAVRKMYRFIFENTAAQRDLCTHHS
jgi:UDP-N-acetylglucosamine diphosphorylase/glucosamine-1-phosphate N-acetyltransferase